MFLVWVDFIVKQVYLKAFPKKCARSLKKVQFKLTNMKKLTFSCLNGVKAKVITTVNDVPCE